MWKGRAKVQLSWLVGSASLNKCSVGEAQHLSIQRSRKWKQPKGFYHKLVFRHWFYLLSFAGLWIWCRNGKVMSCGITAVHNMAPLSSAEQHKMKIKTAFSMWTWANTIIVHYWLFDQILRSRGNVNKPRLTATHPDTFRNRLRLY